MAISLDWLNLRRTAALGRRPTLWQAALPLVVVLAIVGIWALADPTRTLAADPELAHVLRFMAAVKGGMALVALTFVGLRLGAPVAPAQGLGYLLAAGGAAAAPTLIWQLTWIGPAALVFYASVGALAMLGWRDARRSAWLARLSG